MVEATTPTEIKCRTMPSMEGIDATEELIVFLKTYEEAKCTSCQFNWVKSTLPNITSYNVNFDSVLFEYTLTITGTNFGSDSASTEVFIDDQKQEIISGSDTEI